MVCVIYTVIRPLKVIIIMAHTVYHRNKDIQTHIPVWFDVNATVASCRNKRREKLAATSLTMNTCSHTDVLQQITSGFALLHSQPGLFSATTMLGPTMFCWHKIAKKFSTKKKKLMNIFFNFNKQLNLLIL